MDAEKQAWLDSVGIRKLDNPFTHIFMSGRTYPKTMHYTQEYLERTPLDDLIKNHDKMFADYGLIADAK